MPETPEQRAIYYEQLLRALEAHWKEWQLPLLCGHNKGGGHNYHLKGLAWVLVQQGWRPTQ